ncbi:LysR family transcriptional regulator [Balneatrix alpica]|uniref:LysR family transcriptional regulator n=1 Tax=Balneatrix alpica TaxID=75684 RepID=UPI002739044E|nr:LysR family transcriptional regulator [Balneatrix alpica]
MKLRNLDLNLFLMFDALYQQRSVKRAAQVLALSESACSHALARLRQALGDELFVRQGTVMVPTLVADRLAPQLEQSLQLLRQALTEAQGFDPAQSQHCFRLVASDFAQMLLLPGLMAHLAEQAPGVRIQVSKTEPHSLEALVKRETDFVLGIPFEGMIPPQVGACLLLQDEFQLLCRSGHPILQQPLDLAAMVAWPHILVSHWDGKPGVIDQCLRAAGVQRRIQLTLPTPQIAALTLQHTDLLAVMPSRVAAQFAAPLALQVRRLPLQVPATQLQLYFNQLRLGEAAYQWAWQQLKQVLQVVPPLANNHLGDPQPVAGIASQDADKSPVLHGFVDGI